MQIDLITVGQRQPSWINTGYEFYARRLNDDVRLVLKEVAAVKRTGANTAAVIKAKEAERIRKHLPKHPYIVVLDENGRAITTMELSHRVKHWLGLGQNIALVIGGADGLDDNIIDTADETLSLSPMTLPHALVRVLVAEQLYRAWSILKNHPYHRE